MEKRRLSRAVNRADLITQFRYAPGLVAAGNPPIYEPAPYKADPDETVECPSCKLMNDLDASYCDQCDTKLAGRSDVSVAGAPPVAKYEPEPYKADPDETIQCPGCEKFNDLDASFCDQCGLKLADNPDVVIPQSSDKETPAPTEAPAAPAPSNAPAPSPAASSATPRQFAGAPAAPAAPAAAPVVTEPTNPVDENGNIDNNAKCANPDCGHFASAHDDLEAGDNTGPCGMANCTCPQMQLSAGTSTGDDGDADGDDGDDGTGTGNSPVADTDPGPANNNNATASKSKAFAPVPSPGGGVPAEPVEAPPAADPDLTPTGATADSNPPPIVPGGESMGPAFTVPVAIIEGQPTGDGREIAVGALTWRVPPLPLMGLSTETHDPEGWDLNDPAVICGRVDSLERVPGQDGTQVIMAKGFYLPNDDGMYFADLNQAMGRLGISADVAVDAQEINITDVDDDGWPVSMSEILTGGTIMGLTVCPYPAFEGAYIVLGTGEESPEAQPIPQQSNAPEVPSAPPAAVTAGGQLVHFLSYEECEPCNRESSIVAAGGPVRPPKTWFENPNFTEGDGRLEEILDRYGKRVIGGKYACPITVTDDGRVFGHLAPWGICHVGASGQCVTAPTSGVDYAHFKRGQHVITAEGEKVRVGVITADTGHASQTASTSPGAAMAHYDNTALACADVNIGEDEYGIWVAGAIRPDATEEQVRKLRSSSLSGDWRRIGGQLELVAALAVNQPGFPLAVVASGSVESLVAAGATVMYKMKNPTPQKKIENGDTALRRALAPMLGDAKNRAKERLAALRS